MRAASFLPKLPSSNNMHAFPAPSARQDERTLSSRFSSESLKAGQRPRQWLNSLSQSLIPTSNSPPPRERTLSAAETYQISAPVAALDTRAGRASPSRPYRPELPPKDVPHKPTLRLAAEFYNDDDGMESLADSFDDERPVSDPGRHPLRLQHTRNASNVSCASAPAATRPAGKSPKSPRSPLKATPPRFSSRPHLIQLNTTGDSAKVRRLAFPMPPKLSSAFSATTASDRGSVASPSPQRPAFDLGKLQREASSKGVARPQLREQTPFKAQLRREIELWSVETADDERLVTLNVSGERFTIRQNTLNSHGSHISRFVENAIEKAANDKLNDAHYNMAGPLLESWPANFEASTTPSKYHESWPAELDEEGQLVFNLSSLHDSPSKQSQLVTPDTDHVIRSARATVFSIDGVPQDIDEDDWTSDYVLSSQKIHSRNFPAFSETTARGSGASTPSLSTSPSSGMLELPSVEHSKQLIPRLDLPAALDGRDNSSIYSGSSIRRPPSLAADEKVEIFLERNPEPYAAICHYLRTSSLPEALLAQTSEVLDGLDPATLPSGLLKLVLGPVHASLSVLHDEAAWLALEDLQIECARRLAAITNLLETPRPSKTSNFRPMQARFAPVTPSNLVPTPVEERANWI